VDGFPDEWRSSSAWAKYAFANVSRTVASGRSDRWRNLGDRSNGSLRAFSSLLGPLRSPASRAA
jgi:hypothetical protein